MLDKKIFFLKKFSIKRVILKLKKSAYEKTITHCFCCAFNERICTSTQN